MSRPTRNEVERAIEWAEDVEPGSYLAEHPLILVAAAKQYLRLAPDPCPCPGCDFGHHISAGGGGRRCSKCVGGYVWPDSLVLRIAPFFCTGMRLHVLKEPCAVDRQKVVELLDALLGVDGDE